MCTEEANFISIFNSEEKPIVTLIDYFINIIIQIYKHISE